MAEVRARGVIVKQTDYGEGHRMLSIFTEEHGIVKAAGYGAKKSKSKTAAASQFLCYGNFTFFKDSNKDIMTVNSIDTIDGFYPISEDIKKLSLCVYLADITYALLGMNNPDVRIMRLFLNSVYALAYRNESLSKVKTVYELRLMSLCGYRPEIHSCVSCGSGEVYAFDLLKGGTVCRSCGGKQLIKIDKNIYRAMDYILSAKDKKMLAFNAGGALLGVLGSLSEQYVSAQNDTRFASLDYYKKMLDR